MGKLSIVTLITALVVALPAGKLSDIIGRKIILVVSLIVMAITYISWIFIRNMIVVYIIGIYMGNCT